MKRLNANGVACVEYLLAKLDAMIAERTAASDQPDIVRASIAEMRETRDWLRSLLRGENAPSHREPPRDWLH
ncbi:hypothetical protein [Amaricoccus solimangrovi]|uniref:Uncharacterized protein n=1 Tax=Amaricoccus solimangrovi TaxID=2589815 RepID=A0A501WD46_9RHOB|nr:hypothetical protein [Amaricoccus solimangrovi]TPE47308.1 hypothetical protein FJM51_20220 [Amaricoccus solimangrovi]